MAVAGCVDPLERPSSQRDPFGLVPAGAKPSARRRVRSPLAPYIQLSSTPPIAPAPLLASSAGPQASLPPEEQAEEPEPGPTEHPDPSDDAQICPPEMVMIHGDYCLNAIQSCLKWLDQDAPGAPQKRCARFAKPSRCQGESKHMRFCIDRLEYAKTPGDLPVTDVSWGTARAMCEADGKRLCTESEWTFACEGPEMIPYPYGYERNSELCNFDRTDLVIKNQMADHRRPVSAFPECLSPFGVQNMVGNADEWVWLENSHPPMRSGLKGGWWLAGRNRCRPATGGHDEYFHEIQAGFRCCKDAPPSPLE